MRKSGPPRGLISYLMLELLAEKPRYGYEILKEIEEISGGHWEPSYGSVYPILHKFEDEGWAERIERADEPDRKYFELTEAGREHLAEKRRESGSKAREFADVILGFYHVYVAFATDDRFEVEETGDWQFDGTFSAWIAEQVIRHHERDFGEFDRIDDSPETFHEKYVDGDQTLRTEIDSPDDADTVETADADTVETADADTVEADGGEAGSDEAEADPAGTRDGTTP